MIVCICQKCDKKFKLNADKEEKGESAFLQINGCESGGIYEIVIVCPHCDHVHDLLD